jgi:hypothetical protein
MELRKIPLGPFIEILQGLYEDGVNFIDLEGSVNDDGKSLRDTIKITVKPEYLEEEEEEDDDDIQELDREIQIDINDDDVTPLSDDDINKLME